jgi:hypothetical protein
LGPSCILDGRRSAFSDSAFSYSAKRCSCSKTLKSIQGARLLEEAGTSVFCPFINEIQILPFEYEYHFIEYEYEKARTQFLPMINPEEPKKSLTSLFL